MYSIMLAHDVVGTSKWFYKGFPVVTPVTQITNKVMVFSVHTKYNGTIPIIIQTYKG